MFKNDSEEDTIVIETYGNQKATCSATDSGISW